MKRLLLEKLVKWKRSLRRKPLLLQGARQVGKTHLLKAFGVGQFERTHYVNVEEAPRFASAFAGDLSPRGVLRDLSLELGRAVNPKTDLLILDEIQQCPRALTSLKYFAEEMPSLAVCAAGSLLGVHLGECSFPVGKVDEMHLRPLTFEEFLMAGRNTLPHEAFVSIRALEPVSQSAHEVLWREYIRYLVTGGLPEVVAAFQEQRDDEFAAFQEARDIQGRLVSEYLADMAKHCGGQNAMHLARLWRHIPAQVGKDQAGGMPKFVFKGVLPGIHGYERMAGVIDWLAAAGLVLRVPIVNSGQIPPAAFAKENAFKLYVFDIGILGALGQLPVQSILAYDYGTYKGYFAENAVAQSFHAAGHGLWCWREGTAEVEFLTEINGGGIPVEVKSGWVTQSKSLGVFAGKYAPPFSAVFSGRNAGKDERLRRHFYPLYLADRFPMM